MGLKKCFNCAGKGKIGKWLCPTCHGTGKIPDTENIVPAGRWW